MEYARLTTDLDAHGVLTVTMRRSPVNAVDLLMYQEIRELFVDIDQVGPGVRAVVLTGEGKHFCAGNDLDDFATMDRDNVRERMFHVREAFFAIQECAVPVVGAVAGAALGTGVAIAASCDFVVAADDAVFGLPEPSDADAANALKCAEMMLAALECWNEERKARGEPPLAIGIGLNYGPAVLGDVGSKRQNRLRKHSISVVFPRDR